jgi:hypothetical protein
LVQIGVIQNDQRRLAAKFQQDRLEMLRRELGDDATDFG